MTVTRQDRLVRHRGNGAATVFPFAFVIPEASFATVSLQAEDGSLTILAPAQYTLSGVGSPIGGSVTYPLSGSPLSEDNWLVIERTVPYTQDMDIINQGGFYPEVLEKQLDQTVMGLQQLVEPLSRAVKVPVGDSEIILPSAPSRAGKYLAFNVDGDVVMSGGTGADGSLRGDLAQGTGSSLVGYQRNAPGTILQSVNNIFLQTVYITEFGAKFDADKFDDINDATDDTDAWDAALAYLASVGGGILVLPNGASKVTREISIPISYPIILKGTGRRRVYPGVNYVPGTPCPSTVLPIHSDRNAFKFVAPFNGAGSFYATEMNIATVAEELRPTAGWGFQTDPFFGYGFTFYRCGVHNFTSAFDIYQSTTGFDPSVGNIVIDNCAINHNQWIVRTGTANISGTCQINAFKFIHNEAGQNGYLVNQGGINIAGHNITINDNILEATRDPIRIYGSYRSHVIKGNYFESNVGTACINVGNSRSYDIGPNYFFASSASHKVLLSYTGFGKCVDPFWSSGAHKSDIPLLGTIEENRLNTAEAARGLHRFDRFVGRNYGSRPDALTSVGSRVTSPVREFSPSSGLPVLAQEYTTSGAGFIQFTPTISGSSGQWVVACLAFRQITSVAEPYLSLNINTTGGAGSRDFPGFDFALYWRLREWTLLTAATRLGTAMTTLGITFYPYGLSPAADLVSRFFRPFVYVVDDVNKVVPYFDDFLVESVTAAPTVGTWATGDMLKNSAGGFFVCTAGGTPGTWGNIDPV